MGIAISLLVAIGAQISTAVSANANSDQSQIAHATEITGRYTAAIEQTGSDSVEVRLGGIYALQRIAVDSPVDLSTVVEVLSAFVREHLTGRTSASSGGVLSYTEPASDVAAALRVLASLHKHDGSSVPDLVRGDLHELDLSGYDLEGFDLGFADLTNADLATADVVDATLNGANLSQALLRDTDLTGARLVGADLAGASMDNAILKHADLTAAVLINVDLRTVDLTGAILVGAAVTGVAEPVAGRGRNRG